MRVSYVSGLLFALTGGFLCSASAAPQYAPYGNGYGDPVARQGQTVRCESTDGRTRRCPIDTSSGVTLIRQLSDSACVQQRNWGYDRNGVWVAQGCRADFASGGGYGDVDGGNSGNGGAGQVLRCESVDGRYRQCPADASGGVRIARQISGNACIEGRTWGADRGGVWVDRGCRADFELGSRRGNGWAWGRNRRDEGGYGASGAGTMRCESSDGRTNRCAGAVQGVRLQRQLSDALCQQGETWGWDPDGIWVSSGCRADFAVW